jgi:hypothetical protein
VTELFAPVCSIATTRRRRFLWAAWWSGPPVGKPFRKPDAYAGGARTAEEAHRDAERVAGRPLVLVEPRWARAWGRILVGLPPFFGPDRTETVGSDPAPATRDVPRSPFAELGLETTATADEVKRAYRRRALETHPDRGGSDEAFRAVQRAFVAATTRATGAKRRRRRA